VTDAITITIPGKPVPWARAGRYGKVTFELAKQKKWKKDFRLLAKVKFVGPPFPGPVELDITFFFKQPKSWPKKKKNRTKYHTTRPDLSNCLKLLEDALIGIAYHDDAQISRVTVDKLYAGPKDEEGILVDIYPLEDG